MSWQKSDTAPETKTEFRKIGNVMHFRQEYDERQEWFPFIQAVVEVVIKEKPFVPTALSIKQRIGRLRNLPFCDQPYSGMSMYHYEYGVDQYQLPFKEFKSISRDEFFNIKQKGFPAWDLRNGSMITTGTKKIPFDDLIEWLEYTPKGRYRLNSNILTFQFLADYAMFTMRFK